MVNSLTILCPKTVVVAALIVAGYSCSVALLCFVLVFFSFVCLFFRPEPLWLLTHVLFQWMVAVSIWLSQATGQQAARP